MARYLTLGEAERICRRHGLPLTVQRRMILEALAPRTDHPTADQILADVRERAPEISRTTVYRVLEAFVRVEVARKVCHPGAVARYEIVRDRHHHLVCLVCGRMTDFEDSRLDQLPLPDSKAHGFELTDYSIQFRGICAGCAQATEASARVAKTKRKKSGTRKADRK
jgi:Fur family peroxide stress response transcriptional regulator